MIQSQLVSDTGDGQDPPEASEGKGSHGGRSPSPVLSLGRRLEDPTRCLRIMPLLGNIPCPARAGTGDPRGHHSSGVPHPPPSKQGCTPTFILGCRAVPRGSRQSKTFKGEK